MAAATRGNFTTAPPPSPSRSGGPTAVARWICPNCEREFAARQAHVCVPGISVDELLSRHPAWVAEVYEAIIEHLSTLGPVHEDAVNVGVFLKSDRKLADVPAPGALGRAAGSSCPTPSTIRGSVAASGPALRTGTSSSIKLTRPADVDDQVRAWLAEAYDLNTD